MRPRLHELTGRNAENVSRITLQVKAETEDAFKGEDRRARIEGGYKDTRRLEKMRLRESSCKGFSCYRGEEHEWMGKAG